MRLLVTGGAGFIGSNYLHFLLHGQGAEATCCADQATYAHEQESLEVLNVDAFTYAGDPANLVGVGDDERYQEARIDIADADAVEAAFRDFQPEAVVHFAAESHVDRSIDGGLIFARTNVTGTQVLLDAARRHDVDRFIHISTDEVYGSIEQGSFTEEDPYAPSSPYSATKAGSDLLALAHHHTYATPITVTRCTNNFGPRQHAEKLLPKVIQLASRNERLPIYGSGAQVRDWLYVKDHATAVETIREQGNPGEVYNIAAQDERTNLQVVHDILGHLGKPDSLIEHVTDRLGHDFRYSLDDSKLRALGWAPKTSFRDGLAHTMAWMERSVAT